MTHVKKLAAVAAIAIGLSFASYPAAHAASDDAPVKADNTKVNIRDRNAAEMTADQQGSGQQDRELTQQIRKQIMADKTLSTYAHNLKIIANNGTVTLKGPVKTEAERQAVLNTAMTIAGGSSVTDEISIQP